VEAGTAGEAGHFGGAGGFPGQFGGEGGFAGLFIDASAGGAAAGAGGDAGTGFPFPGRCGRNECPEHEYCSLCTPRSDERGECRPRPRDCTLEDEPVCTCKGLRGNACLAHGAGLAVIPGCPAPVGRFPCGGHFCRQGKEYCRLVDGGEPDTEACLLLPAMCAASADCSCLAAAPCGSTCSQPDGGASGDLTVTCPNP